MSFFDKIKEGAKKGTELAQQTVEVTKINSQISGKKKEVEERYNQIGHIVYEAHRANRGESAEAPILKLCSEVSSMFQEIAALEQRINAIKKEKVCTCGSVVSSDIKFCPKCGANHQN
jgi:ABC-type ATPase with predicted acetyltransferase domain